MFTSSPPHILCWEDSWKQELISHPFPTPHKHAGYAKSTSLHVTAADITQAAGREQPPPSSPSSSSSSSPGRTPPCLQHRAGPIRFWVFFIILALLLTLFNFPIS